MNDKDLERQLRSQRGPRERGYQPADLPATLNEGGATRGPSPLVRAAVLVPALAAGVIAVVVAGVLLRGNGTGNVGGGVTTPPPSATASEYVATQQPSATAPDDGEPIACAADDLAFADEPWGGAAGSRGTVITVSLEDGRPACLVSTGVSGRIADANGTVLVSNARVLMRFPNVVIRPGDQFTIGVSWSNWCGEAPARPLSLEIQVDNIPTWIVVSDPVSTPTVPPCMGENSPGNLSLTLLQPAP
jgi:hypothetical protein